MYVRFRGSYAPWTYHCVTVSSLVPHRLWVRSQLAHSRNSLGHVCMRKCSAIFGQGCVEYTRGKGRVHMVVPAYRTIKPIFFSHLSVPVYTHNYPLYIIISWIEYFSQPVSLTKAEISLYNKYFLVAIEWRLVRCIPGLAACGQWEPSNSQSQSVNASRKWESASVSALGNSRNLWAPTSARAKSLEGTCTCNPSEAKLRLQQYLTGNGRVRICRNLSATFIGNPDTNCVILATKT